MHASRVLPLTLSRTPHSSPLHSSSVTYGTTHKQTHTCTHLSPSGPELSTATTTPSHCATQCHSCQLRARFRPWTISLHMTRQVLGDESTLKTSQPKAYCCSLTFDNTPSLLPATTASAHSHTSNSETTLVLTHVLAHPAHTPSHRGIRKQMKTSRRPPSKQNRPLTHSTQIAAQTRLRQH